MNLLRCSMLALCIALGTDPGSLAWGLSPVSLADLLRAGNLTLYFRHTATDFSQSDRDDRELADCSKQRNLTEKGRSDARAIGEAMRAMKLPVEEVLASPYCRTLETARLITGRATKSPDVRGHVTTAGRPDYAALEKILSTPPAAGTLRIIASHGNPFFAIAGEPRLDEGEAAVIRGDGKSWAIVARIKVGDWVSLAKPSR